MLRDKLKQAHVETQADELTRLRATNAQLQKENIDLKVGINHLCGLETTCEDLETINAQLLAACKEGIEACGLVYLEDGRESKSVEILRAAIKAAEEV